MLTRWSWLESCLPLTSCWPFSSLMMYDSQSGLFWSISASFSHHPVLWGLMRTVVPSLSSSNVCSLSFCTLLPLGCLCLFVLFFLFLLGWLAVVVSMSAVCLFFVFCPWTFVLECSCLLEVCFCSRRAASGNLGFFACTLLADVCVINCDLS